MLRRAVTDVVDIRRAAVLMRVTLTMLQPMLELFERSVVIL